MPIFIVQLVKCFITISVTIVVLHIEVIRGKICPLEPKDELIRFEGQGSKSLQNHKTCCWPFVNNDNISRKCLIE